VIVTALAAAFQTYDQIAVLTKDGGPNNSTNLLLFNARIDFSNGDYNRANAQSVILVIALLLLTALAYWFAEGRKKGAN
jgi:ABC-type sugar transport system permease subunit